MLEITKTQMVKEMIEIHLLKMFRIKKLLPTKKIAIVLVKVKYGPLKVKK